MAPDATQSTREFVAFHGNPAVKAFYLERLRSHVDKEEIVQGFAEWNGGKGGVIGCTVHSSDRSRYEPDLGIPTEVASLEEIIFERLPEEEAKRFALEFLEAVPVGADLSFVWPAIARWLLIDPSAGSFDSRRRQRPALPSEGGRSLCPRPPPRARFASAVP